MRIGLRLPWKSGWNRIIFHRTIATAGPIRCCGLGAGRRWNGGRFRLQVAILGQIVSCQLAIRQIISDPTSVGNRISDVIFGIPALTPEEIGVVGQIDDLRARLSYATRQPKRWLGVLRRSTFARAIQGSNSIEGYNVTFEDAVAAIENEEPLDAKSEAWEAVRGYRDAMTYIMHLADEPSFGFSHDILKSLHFMMMKYDLSKRPGRFRLGHIYVRNDQTGEKVYDGPDIELVPRLMDELTDCLNSPDNQHALVRAAMSHLNLVMIHPFADGNGRMARALQTFVLAREGIGAPEFSSIEEYLGRNTQAYYQVLADVGAGSWHPERSARDWIRFCLTAHYRQAMTLLRRTREWEKIWEELEQLALDYDLPDRSVLALFDATMGWRVRNATYRNAAEISENLASRDLKILSDQGLIIPQGERRGRFYVAANILTEIRTKVRERRPIPDPFQTGLSEKEQSRKDQPTLPGLS
jgi:Fic family protein